MKNRYMIVKHTGNGDIYYNADCNLFAVKHGTTFTSKKKASEAMKYACKYASGIKSGDISPLQALQLKDIQNQLTDLIMEVGNNDS